jgi:hypothetical protein
LQKSIAPYKWQDHQRGQKVTRPVEQVDAPHLPGETLRYEGGAPDAGDEEEGEIGFETHGTSKMKDER